MRYLIYLLCLFILQVVAWIITPLLPLFRQDRFGPIDNANGYAVEPRLPDWLSIFMTPDNSLWGDNNWKAKQDATRYWAMVGWLYRNSLYGFKWSVLSAPMDAAARVKTGQQAVGWLNPGFQRIRMGDYWQWHLVKQIGPVTINWNFGWLINDGDQPRALFMFSPRVRFA